MNGPAWERLLERANAADGNDAYISDQDYMNNVDILAAAIVYARTGDEQYKNKVVTACEKLVNDGFWPATPNTGRNDYNRTLAWGRETGAYVLAADLVGYRTPEFEQWCRNIAEVWQDAANGWTLLYTFKHRPNNWGSHAFSSLAAIYAYLQDTTRLNEIYNDEVGLLLGNPPPECKWGSDLSWHLDENNPKQINPKGAVKNGINIDGIAPDDMRRGGSLADPPAHTGYAWEFLQGILPGVRIMHRLGYPILSVADSPFARAVYALQVRLASEDSYWKATGDDEWQLPFWDEMYGTNYSDEYPKSADPTVSRIYDRGKNAGWGYVTLANKVLTVNASVNGSGVVTFDTPDGRYLEGAVATLTADPDLGWVFDHWEGDVSGTENPVSITMDSNKNVTAVFVQSQTTQYTLTVSNSGSGTVSISPPGGNYDAGTDVTLTANPSSGWRFEYWSGDLSGNTNPVTITMDNDKNITAVYSQATEIPVVSVIASADDGNVPANTLDNDLNTRWSASGDGQWIQYDLGSVHTISYISLALYKGDQRTYYFDIEVSNDATNWTQVYSGSSDGTTTAQQEYHFPDVSARYLRIVGHQNSYNSWNSYTEVDIYSYESGNHPTQYTLTTSVSGSGSLSLSPSGGVYDAGTEVTITATPGSGWQFDGWSGDLSGTTNPATITMDANKTVTATFSQISATQYTLTTKVVGSGTVSADPAGGTYDEGTIVTLTATPASGWQFDGWSGDLSGTSNPATITMDANKTITATFSSTSQTPEILSVSSVIASADDGNVPSNTLDDDLSTRWSAEGDGQWIRYDLGASYTIAYLSIGWYKGDQRVANFDIEISSDGASWTQVFSGSSSGTTTSQETVEIADTEGRYVRIVGHGNSANNWNSITEVDIYGYSGTQPPKYTLTTKTNGSGTVTLDPAGGTYNSGTVVTVTAKADPGWQFDGWSGDLSGTSNPATITMDSNKTITATFSQIRYTLSVNSSGQGTVVVSPYDSTNSYLSGTEITLTATADSGWQFTGWSGDLTGTTNPATITMDSNMIVTANFSNSTGTPVELTIVSTTASTGESSAGNTIDNNMNTKWSVSPLDAWIQYDLGANYTISYLTIAWERGDWNGYQYIYDIEVSGDGVNWTVVAERDTSAKTAEQQIADFPDVAGRYVRVINHGKVNGNSWIGIYELDVFGFSGLAKKGSIEPQIGIEIPKEYILSQNYPNPFNPTTVIKYGIPKSSYVSLKIYNLQGQEVKVLVNEEKPAGTYKVVWDGYDQFGSKVASGVYIYRFTAGNFVATKKMLLLK